MTPDPLRSPEAPHADQPRSIQAGDVVQIDPMHDERFGGCLLLVTEAKSWGVMGFVSIPHADGPTRRRNRPVTDTLRSPMLSADELREIREARLIWSFEHRAWWGPDEYVTPDVGITRAEGTIVVMTVVLPMPLNLANARLHWTTKHRGRARYFEVCDLLLAAKQIPPPPEPAPVRAVLSSEMVLGGRMDTDNAMARHKWAIDWLVFRKYLTGDSERHLRWDRFPHQTISRKRAPVLRLTILEEF